MSLAISTSHTLQLTSLDALVSLVYYAVTRHTKNQLHALTWLFRTENQSGGPKLHGEVEKNETFPYKQTT